MRIVALWIVILKGARACEVDEDCSLNGLCIPNSVAQNSNTKVCKCDPGWFGEDCGRLDLAPAKRHNGYNYSNFTDSSYYGKFGNSSWGGQILRDPIDRRLFHLFVDQFAHGCGLSGWRPHSFVIRAESTTGPQGPFRFAQKISSTFRHNAFVFFSPADKKYLLYAIGADTMVPSRCQSFKWPNNISVASADSIRGPWSSFKMVLKSPHSTNPAPWPLWSPQDLTSKIMLGIENNDIYIAERWDGKYQLVKSQEWNTSHYSQTWTEDPFFWRDKRGHWHAVNHWMVDIVEQEKRKWPRVGAHIFARELTGPWQFKLHEAFNSTVTYTDGRTETLKRRERPKLFFSDDGEVTPLYLITGVQDMDKTGPSHTFIQPIGTKWRDYEREIGL
jgi:hypothetical protein